MARLSAVPSFRCLVFPLSCLVVDVCTLFGHAPTRFAQPTASSAARVKPKTAAELQRQRQIAAEQLSRSTRRTARAAAAASQRSRKLAARPGVVASARNTPGVWTGAAGARSSSSPSPSPLPSPSPFGSGAAASPRMRAGTWSSNASVGSARGSVGGGGGGGTGVAASTSTPVSFMHRGFSSRSITSSSSVAGGGSGGAAGAGGTDLLRHSSPGAFSASLLSPTDAEWLTGDTHEAAEDKLNASQSNARRELAELIRAATQASAHGVVCCVCVCVLHALLE